ncbi:STAS domain-containing protein [Amycolatopsis sp. PS_44_ISF1]|uniref:STAS domain-containing protein n=1 Tax=Amycolatopsis sp. PS_44_ISF1 TaxID=2974917 RepID=UPI0028DDED82|nr:STAS domain-containing protein [Amycolatopsis sp. PS_44_ISF1]MDT8913040.1 STAS domain-containing protein [Amycolatopsis sp. PS_44_ISF1]
MTSPNLFACTWTSAHPGVARVTVTGELDFDTHARLVCAVQELLAEPAHWTDVHLDCGRLAFCDSSGLSGLLMVRRLVHGAGALLHVDHRSAELDRLLKRTNLLTHFTDAAAETAQHWRQET